MIIRDFTDNDLYKFTTLNAIMKKFHKAEVAYQFINRGNTPFPDDFANALRDEVNAMQGLSLTPEAESFIRQQCPYFDNEFIVKLRDFRFNPDEVRISQHGTDLSVDIRGKWWRTVLWEVPVLAIISELYFQMTGQKPDDFKPRAIEKSKEFAAIGAHLTDFGTRRRFSFNVHDKVIAIMKEHMGNCLDGTSNVYLAMKHGIKPIGTHPHEWFMYHGAHFGYKNANNESLKNWVDVYKGKLAIALTDTYTSDNFFQNFSKRYSEIFYGLRWDSGDPFEFTDKAINHYSKFGIDPREKIIVYSDALNLEKVKSIRKYAGGKVKDLYGIGTCLTNDVGVTPLNIVIKMTAAKPEGFSDFVPVVKLSDVVEKNTGVSKEIKACLKAIEQVQ
ncbi:MAG: nicotinate phosphoribosyltransferase [Prolixibacteraceae bacterium]|nr:nicotinate phosphoribosyltransferase [Prolixibacteraceae bacterium]